ncbi:MAG: ABC transporter permease [Clostridia bacterium]|nr:ABC transporter permease [Clostridia bacterium]
MIASLTRFFKGDRLAIAALFVTAAIVLVALLAPLLVPYDRAVAVDTMHGFLPPSPGHPFGTDKLGHDILAQLVWGSRPSLAVGLFGTGLAAVLGTAAGLVAGFGGPWLDAIFVYVIDILMAFPLLLLALVMVAMMGASLANIVIAVGVSWAPRYARLVRGLVLELRTLEYVQAARSAGASTARILFVHVLRNALGPILVMFTLGVASSIIVEASLSFLGLGPPPPTPTWGRIIAAGQPYVTAAPWICIFPGLAILVTVLALNLLGDGIRDGLDPRTRNLGRVDKM